MHEDTTLDARANQNVLIQLGVVVNIRSHQEKKQQKGHKRKELRKKLKFGIVRVKHLIAFINCTIGICLYKIAWAYISEYNDFISSGIFRHLPDDILWYEISVHLFVCPV